MFPREGLSMITTVHRPCCQGYHLKLEALERQVAELKRRLGEQGGEAGQEDYQACCQTQAYKYRARAVRTA